MIRIQYYNEEEKQFILEDKLSNGYQFAGEENITEGDFILFREPGELPPEPEKPIQEQIAEMNVTIKRLEAILTMNNESFSELTDALIEMGVLT